MAFKVDRLTSTIWSVEETNTPSDTSFATKTSADRKTSTFDRDFGTFLVKGTDPSQSSWDIAARDQGWWPPQPGEELRYIRWAWRVLSAGDIYDKSSQAEREFYEIGVRNRLCKEQASISYDALEAAVKRDVAALLFQDVADKADAGTLSQEEFDRYAPWVWRGGSVQAAAAVLGEPPNVDFDEWLN